MITLKAETAKSIKDDKSLFIKLQSALGVTEKTMYGYINDNSVNLTKLSCIDIMVDHWGKPLSELIEGGKVSKLLAR